MKVVNSGGSDEAISSANQDRKEDFLTEKDYLRSINNQLRLMNTYLAEMTGLEINEDDLEHIK
jgi:hypothetical protein